MKTCPTCNRTYEDDTLVFCLDDGGRLSAPYEPHSTLRGPAARDTNPPGTEVLPSGPIPAFTSSAHPQGAPHSQLAEKRGSKHWIILGGILTLVVVGLVIGVGYLALNAGNKAPGPSRASSTAPTNSNVPANANRQVESNPTGHASFQWLDGVWEGEGYQSDTKTTWDVRLTVQDGQYAIDYPNIPCAGKWTLIDNTTSEARFIEEITQGKDRCATNSHVTIQKVSESEISGKYTYAQSRAVIATVVLTRKSP
jgi:hypothetical protein